MTNLVENQEYKLTVTFLNKTRIKSGGFSKVIKVTESDNKYCYYGSTKKEAIEKAKKAFRYSSSYKKEWSIENI